jgi:hypothetical protein
VVVTVNDELAPAATDPGLKLGVVPAGLPATLSVTLPLKPLSAAVVTV